MAVSLSRTRSQQLQMQRKYKEGDVEDNNDNNGTPQKRAAVAVVYYLSRNGHLEHPHFLEVPLSSPQGLFLRDVIHRLNLLRGKSMASHYSWSSKRSYKSGYVWQDLEENDFIHPVHGGEYVLKGSEIFETTSSSSPPCIISKSPETSSSSNGPKPISYSGPGDTDFSAVRNRRRNQSWGSSMDLQEYKVYKAESTHEFSGKAAADASTQTDDKRRRRKATVVIKEEPEIEEEERIDNVVQQQQQQSTELSRGEISPPPSDSSPETLESLMKADGRLILANINLANSNPKINPALSTSSSSHAVVQTDGMNPAEGYCPSGRMKASSVLMSLISCGSISFRDCGATAVKDHGLSLISQYKPRPPRGGNRTVDNDVNDGDMIGEMEKNVSSSFAKMALEEKEYFSGSLIETTKKDHFSALKRSSSYNAERSSHLNLEAKQMDGVRARCIPRRPKTQPSKKNECTAEITSVTINSTQDGVVDQR